MSYLKMLGSVSEIKNYEMRDIHNLRSELPNESNLSQYTEEEIKKFTEIAEAISERNEELKTQMEERNAIMQGLLDGSIESKVIAKFDGKDHERNLKMETENKELRSLQLYLSGKEMNTEERAALVTTNAGAVIPKTITEILITDKKYSDLLRRATVFGESHQGDISVPIASGITASWKAELEDAEDASPTLTELKLSGHEIMDYAKMSAAAYGLSYSNFESQLLMLLQEALMEKLEHSFIHGTGIKQASGLSTLTFTEDNTVTAEGPIGYEHLAKALSKLPQQYSRNAIIMANNDTIFTLNKYGKEFAETLNKEIVPNEHIPSGLAYVCDPRQLYVRFFNLQVEADRSSSFRSGAVDFRALALADAKWNPKAVVKVVATLD